MTGKVDKLATAAEGATYVLITPARNEEGTIGITIESVIRQTVLPTEWVIVSDGSTDRTDEIIGSYAARFPFINFVRLANRPKRNFASMVFTVREGLAALKSKDYEFLGMLDADIRFNHNYYEEILRRFTADPHLGLAGGVVIDCHPERRRSGTFAPEEVAGGVQFFRRECFEIVGGPLPIPEGGFDAIMCAQARMHGFKTRTFEEIEVDHLKPRNAAEGKVWRRLWQFGKRDYARGSHPLFELLKCARGCLSSPILIGGTVRFLGFALCYAQRKERMISAELIQFVRQEQLARIFLRRPVQLSRAAVHTSAQG
jgi:poly-beta-1,6-N-acetyl-D-glucosamine synthase